MQLLRCVYKKYIFEISSSIPPKIGDRFKDDKDIVWIIRSVNHGPGGILRNPPPPAPIWEICLESEHPAYTLKAGQELKEII